MPVALITGITGQDGMYLAELLIDKDYRVYGLVRGQNNPKVSELVRALPEVEILYGDLKDMTSLIAALEVSQPDEVYNLGAMSFVALSFLQPELTYDITGLGVHRMLEGIRILKGAERQTKFYQASSSEMFGLARETPQCELTPFHPRSPYGIAKVMGHDITVNYREAYGIFACNGILFNHESPRRGTEFVTRKVTREVARISLGLEDRIRLGNLDAERDWGFAGDYVEAMWLMLQQDEPSDYVVGTGKTHTVRDLVRVAFACVGVDDWESRVEIDEGYMRPAEVEHLCADAAKAQTVLGWTPNVDFEGLISMMVEADLEREKGLAG